MTANIFDLRHPSMQKGDRNMNATLPTAKECSL